MGGKGTSSTPVTTRKGKGTRVMNNANDIETRAASVSKLSLFGSSATAFPDKISPVRGVMSTRQQTQRVVLNDPEFCRLFTGAENPLGKRSSWNIKADANYEIVKIFHKFKDFPQSTTAYILKNVHTGEYKCKVFNPAVNLIEKFGFRMINGLSDKHEGDFIPKGYTIGQSTSFVNDNYCGGLNARMVHAVLPGLTEDAIEISSDFAERGAYNMVDNVEVDIGKNAFLLNRYGNNEVYKSFPDIGESIADDGVLLSIRENSFISSAREASVPHITDMKKISHGIVVDIDINSNCDIDNEQFNYYRKQITEYYTEIYTFISSIISNINCERQISTSYDDTDEEEDPYDTQLLDLYHQAEKYLSPSTWVTKEYIVDTKMKFTILNRVPIRVGQKIVGRYGNKSVVTKIIPTHLMPKTDDGRPIDIKANALSINNRIISFVLYELTITFQTERYFQDVLRRHEAGEDHDKIAEDVSIFIGRYSPHEGEEFMRIYRENPQSAYNDLIKNGIFIHVPPLGDVCMRDACLEVYDAYPDIMKKHRVLSKLRHRWIELDDEYAVGYQYTWVLKQEPSKTMSTVSTGRTTLYDQPVKTRQYNKNLRWYSDNAIKFGEYDTYNMLAGASVRDFARVSTYFRGSQYTENSILMSHLSNREIDITKYNAFPQLDNLKNILKFIGESLKQDIFGYNTIGADDVEYDVQLNNVSIKISIPLLRYVLIINSYYMKFVQEHGTTIDMCEFFESMRTESALFSGRSSEEIVYILQSFVELLPTLQQMKEY